MTVEELISKLAKLPAKDEVVIGLCDEILPDGYCQKWEEGGIACVKPGTKGWNIVLVYGKRS